MGIRIAESIVRQSYDNAEIIECEGLLELTFNVNLSKEQVKAGILGKVNITHPAFSTTGTIWKGNNGIARIQTSSTKIGEKSYFNFVTLEAGVRNYVLREFLKFKREAVTPWYLSALGKKEVEVNCSRENPSLDITEIIVDANLTDSQRKAGIVAKASLITSVGVVRSYTIFGSKFGNQLYGAEPAENPQEERTKQVPAFRLSREAEAQVLAYIHTNSVFDEEEEIFAQPEERVLEYINPEIENSISEDDIF